MSYVDHNLIAGETVAYRSGLHWTVIFWPTLLAILLAIPGGVLLYTGNLERAGGAFGAALPSTWKMIGGGILLLVALILFARAAMERNAAEFAITNKRIILRSGLAHRRSLEMFLNKVESIAVDQSFGGRMLGYGTVMVRGTGGTAETFPRVASPMEFRQRAQEQIGQSGQSV